MKSTATLVLAAALLGTGFVQPAHADDDDRRRSHRRQGIERRHSDRDVRYIAPRDVYVIRDYYRPQHRPLPPGLRIFYARNGHLPRGWAKRIRPIPVHVERRLPVLPRGYRRGIIDGHAVVHNSNGLIIDVAVLF